MFLAKMKFWATEKLGILTMASEIDEWLKKVGDGNLNMLVKSWWEEINESVGWRDGIFFTLSALFALISFVALVQLIRIELRVPKPRWTFPKVFHLMNFVGNGVRAIVFGLHKQLFILSPRVLMLVLLDLPGLLFFSTYTLLVLFWAGIYHQIEDLPADKLKLVYILLNAGTYLIQVCLWIFLWLDDNKILEISGRIFIAVISLLTATSFLVYGRRLFKWLRQRPSETPGRRKKLYEVGSVAAICFTCFLIRCIVVLVSAFDVDAALNVLDHPILDFTYYMLVEIVPSALVLFILRQMPPKRTSGIYHPIG